MHSNVARVTLIMLVFAAAGRMSAHHSVPVNFDQTREISIEGVLTQILWVNPHAHFRIDVLNPDGTKVEWLVEMGASNTMKRAGFPWIVSRLAIASPSSVRCALAICAVGGARIV